MITKIEIDGFKSFERFSLSLPPFAVIIGPNAAGKSNLFDALRLLSRLATNDVRTAMKELRGEPLELFRRMPDGSIAKEMRIAVETLLEKVVRDDFGEEDTLKHTRIRYELMITRREEEGIEKFFVEQERASPILKKDERWQPLGKPLSKSFREHFLLYGKPNPFLDTIGEGEQRRFELRQDGKAGRIRRVPALGAYRSVLSQVALVQEFPHLVALKQELSSLRYLQLDAAAERQPSPTDAPETLERDGSNLAAVLFRIMAETATSDARRGVLVDIRNELASLVPGVVDLMVERDDERREYRLKVAMRDGQTFSSRVLSDGTLRILALLTLLYDPRQRGVLCFEEPENGVSQLRLHALIEFLEESCTDPLADGSDSGPLRQIIVNTHSPIAARAAKRSVILAGISETTEPGASGPPRQRTTMRPYVLSEQPEQLALFPEREKIERATHQQIEQMLKSIERSDDAA